MELSNVEKISSIWNTFLCPVLDTVIVWLYLSFLLGKKRIIQIRRHFIPDMGGYYFHKKFFLPPNGKPYTLYIPFKNTFIDKISNPYFMLGALLIFSFIFQRLITFTSRYSLIERAYDYAAIMLHSVDESTIAKVWVFNKSLNIYELAEKVTTAWREDTYSPYWYVLYNIECTINFCRFITFFSGIVRIFALLFTACPKTGGQKERKK